MTTKIKNLKEVHAKLDQFGLNFYTCNMNTKGESVTNGGTYVVYDPQSEQRDGNGNHLEIWMGDRKELFAFAEQLVGWTRPNQK